MNHLDLGWWLYFITAIGAWYGFGLFSWWKWKHNQATAVYQYVRFLLLGIAVMNTGSVYVRWYLNTDPTRYMELLHSSAWANRLWITLIFVWVIVLHMSYRAFFKRK